MIRNIFATNINIRSGNVTNHSVFFFFVGDQVDHSSATSRLNGETVLPKKWNRKTDLVYGLSDSLYDINQVTKCKNGNPIADCYGIIARGDSAILALADGVNWGMLLMKYL